MDDSRSRFRWNAASETSPADLLRECGRRLTDRTLWTEFQKRYHSRILLYLTRALRQEGMAQDVGSLVSDLAQELYLFLIARDGHVLKSFRGTSEFAACAFLARLCAMMVLRHLEDQKTLKRTARVVSIDEVRAREERSGDSAEQTDFDPSSLTAVLAWIDIERVVEGDPDRKNARRNALIFKLHYIDGLSAAEIASFPGFELTQNGVDTVLARLRKRIQS